MASVYKRPGSRTWQCAFYIKDAETGKTKQVRKSTGKRNEREAKNAAADIERQEREKAGAGNKASQNILKVMERAASEARKETLNAARARELLAEIVKISTGEDMPVYTITSWLGEWLRRKSEVTAESTGKRYKASVKAFCEWLGSRAEKPMESLTVSDIREFRSRLREEGRTANTAQKYVQDISSALRVAVREGYLNRNPASGLDPLEYTDSISRSPFTIESMKLLVKHAPSKDWKGVILCGFFTGLRLGDIAKLKWESVDLNEGTILVTPSKDRKKRELCVPLHRELKSFLMEHPSADSVDAPVFPSLARRSVSGKRGLSMSFVDVMAEAGVSRGKARIVPKESAGRTTYEYSFHSLRHSFVSALTNADVSEDLRMKLAGHSDADVHALYSHHNVETLAKAIDKVPGLNQ